MAKSRARRQPYRQVQFSPPRNYQESIVVELRYEAPVAPADGRFVGRGEEGVATAERLNQLVAGGAVADVRPSFMVKSTAVKQSLEVAEALPPEAPSERIAARIKRRDE